MEQAFNFPVETQPLFTADGKKSDRVAVVRTDTNRILSTVGQGYKIVHHSEIFSLADDYMRTIGQPDVKYHTINNGARIVGEYTFKEVYEDVKKGDTVGLRLYFLNSYDGSSSISMSVGGLRLVCTNGMIVPGAEYNTKYRHSGNNIINGKLINVELPKPENVILSFKNGFDSWRKLASIELDDVETYRRKAIEEGIISAAVEKKVPTLEEQTAWGLYNNFTQYITHEERSTASQTGKIMRYNRVATWFNEVFA
jgi:hypothetical protein